MMSHRQCNDVERTEEMSPQRQMKPLLPVVVSKSFLNYTFVFIKFLKLFSVFLQN